MELTLDSISLSEAILAYLEDAPALLIIAMGLAAFIESLAIVGVIVPGVAIIVAFSLLASTAEVEVFPLLLSGAVGSFLGDSLSFWLGKHSKDALLLWRPLKKRPELVARAYKFCHRYGIASLLIGRFIGPLRPLVPMTAGILNYSWNRFLLAALIGCLLWAPVYILPGYYSVQLF